MSAEELARRLGARRVGAEYVALCPAHADESPSLNFRDRDGRLVVRCRAGCAQEDVWAALRAVHPDLLGRRDEPAPRPAAHVARHEIRDTAGALVAVHVREDLANGSKRMFWQGPDGERGLSGTPAAELPLYGAEQLQKLPPDAGVILTEGEKATDAVRCLRLPALGTVTGAASCPSAPVLESLRGRRVFLWPDADEAGRAHMDRVGRALTGIASEVRLLTWGEPGSKDDAADFVAAGGTREQLVGLVKAAPLWGLNAEARNRSASDGSSRGLPLIRIGDLLDEPDEECRWLVEGILPAGGLSLLAAKPKVGKSTLARCLCAAVAGGEPWLGAVVERGAVIYLGLEEKRGEVKRHFRALGVDEAAPLFVYVDLPPLDGIEKLRESVAIERPALVVIDGLFRLIRAADANAYAELYSKLSPLLALARESGAHVMMTHHEGKGAADRDGQDGVLGSTAIVGTVDVTFALRKERGTGRRTIQSTARYGDDLAERLLLIDEAGLVTLGDTREAHEQSDAERALLAALAGQTGPMTEKGPDGIEGLVTARTGTLRRALRALVSTGQVTRSGEGRRGFPYLYALPNDPETRVSGSEIYTGTRNPNAQPAPLERGIL